MNNALIYPNLMSFKVYRIVSKALIPSFFYLSLQNTFFLLWTFFVNLLKLILVIMLKED